MYVVQADRRSQSIALAVTTCIVITACGTKAPGDVPAGFEFSGTTQAAQTCGAEPAPDIPVGAVLSHTRLWRRINLNLLGRPPAVEDYEAILALPDDAARDQYLSDGIDSILDSVAFYKQMVDFGKDYIGVGAYERGGRNETNWVGSQAAGLRFCPSGSLHEDKLGLLHPNRDDLGDPTDTICNDPAAPVANVVPWFSPTTTVAVIGRAVPGATSVGGVDCGRVNASLRWNYLPDPGCSCGANLEYCIPRDAGSFVRHNSNHREDAQRRQLHEEPARLFAHLIVNDRPFSDLVLGNYSVMPLALRGAYVRAGRMSGVHPEMDGTPWWDAATWSSLADPAHDTSDPQQDLLAWHEVVVADLNPHLLALSPNNARSGSIGRTYTFDPRVDAGEPEGMPAAGVLTMMGSLSAFPRERVRAARFLETFACRSFRPPPPEIEFNQYVRDPHTEGVCQHCHVTIDPASVFFKRWSFNNSSDVPGIFGLGPWAWSAQAGYAVNQPPFLRFKELFIFDSVIAPISQDEFVNNPDAIMMDFLDAGYQLFGDGGDGTIGPLGFAKILVQSGEFDSCAVRRMYERFVGRKIDPASESAFLDQMVTEFVSNNRQVRPLIRTMMADPQFRRGF